MEQPLFMGFWQNLGRVVVTLIAEKAHASITITVRDGHLQPIELKRQFLPTQLPQVPR